MPGVDGFRAERNFGLLVGGVFTFLGAWWVYRGRFGPLAPFVVALGIVLVVAGALLPRVLVWPNRGWMAAAEAISFVMTRLVLAVVFFIAVTPIGLIRRLTGSDPLRRRTAPAPSYWEPYPERQRNPRHYEKMF